MYNSGTLGRCKFFGGYMIFHGHSNNSSSLGSSTLQKLYNIPHNNTNSSNNFNTINNSNNINNNNVGC